MVRVAAMEDVDGGVVSCRREVGCAARSPLVSRRPSARPHCTLPETAAAPVSVNVHVFALFPPLEQVPDQMASRPFVTLSVICVLVANDADPLLPTGTLIPAGLDVICSPLRPVAFTVRVAVVVGGGDGGGGGAAAGFTVRMAVCVVPL